MKKTAAAVIATICPLVMAGLLTACEMGCLSIGNTVALGAGCIYAEWWGLTAFDHTEE